ncbi:MAG: penicillin acylase family protein [Flavipsychrobacter sp.]|nr:penicillin acylase family protein [Flavipsychrobacter sp.]
MRKLIAILPLVFTSLLVYFLTKPMGSVPALGKLLDPVTGCWASAESVNKNFNNKLKLDGLKEGVTISFDERLVPHIQAGNDYDLYYTQGYLHAYFRLWQMDLQTRAAAGRVSEVLGDKALKFDRTQRRKGMVYGAEQSLKAMEADPRSKQMLDAYTAGINAYINTLSFKTYPLEYKLAGFEPEAWTNLKSALLLKYMADDLTGYTEDIALTMLRDVLSPEEFAALYPERLNGVNPVIPRDTIAPIPSLKIPAAPADSIAWAHFTATDFEVTEEGKGSNNWAVSGSRTKSGKPILCNDPHLGLNLPSLWYEIQMTAPGVNVYGVSLPGSPGVIIGFNDNISWGFTNNYRDVKDYYVIKPATDNTYMFAGKETVYTTRLETIRIKGKQPFVDKVKYTVHGPVIYDEQFHGPGGLKKQIALTWMAHKPSNEVLSLYLLNRSNSYEDYTKAIHNFLCPAQNMIYADRSGNIALWGQGQFINKWQGQGRYVMNGADSATLWGQQIPVAENPHTFNPAQGYIASANQTVTDTTYPYWYNGYFYEFRSWRINSVLRNTKAATVDDMFALQNDVYSVLAANVLPVMLTHITPSAVTDKEREYLNMLGDWDYRLTAESKAATIFQVWWMNLYNTLWEKRFAKIPDQLKPSPERTMQLLKENSPYLGNIDNAVVYSLRNSVDSLTKLKKAKRLEWYHAKNTSVRHLTKLAPFSFPDLKIGGWGNTVNAAKGDHGPSWRMVVQMGDNIEAYGVYPGGQSGNVGSKYYATFLDKWVKGEYYKLNFYTANTKPAATYTWSINPKNK